MSVAYQHVNYTNRLSQWKRLRDFHEGEYAVRQAGTCYVPKLKDQKQKDYDTYISRGTFLDATTRTHESLCGTVFRNDPKIIIPEKDEMTRLEKDADRSGNSLYDYARHVLDEVLLVGRGGTLVDWSMTDKRPFFSYYAAEDIINWRVESVNDKKMLTLAVLRETVSATGANSFAIGSGITPGVLSPFVDVWTIQYRVLTLDRDKEGNPLRYRVQVWKPKTPTGEPSYNAGAEDNTLGVPKKKKGEEKSDYIVMEEFIPVVRGQPFLEIPFIFHGPNPVDFEPARPPLDGLASLNETHWRTSVDYMYGLHYTALPTPVAIGVNKDDFKGSIGPSEWIVSERSDSKIAYLEFSGQGLSGTKECLNDLKRDMAIFGARVLEGSKAAVETEGAMGMRKEGEDSALMKWTNSVSGQLTRALQWATLFVSPMKKGVEQIGDDEAKITLNTDFTVLRISGPELQALSNAYSQSHISYETYWWNLTRGEMAPPGVTAEEELERIKKNPPPTLDPLLQPPAPAPAE